MFELKIFTDGGSRGNPGPAASGVYITDESNTKVTEIGKTLGVTTNNVAEYTAVILALEWFLANPKQTQSITKISFYMDSLLVCSQLTGKWKIKDANMARLAFIIREHMHQIKLPITFTHVPRAQNKEADRMVNWALDNEK